MCWTGVEEPHRPLKSHVMPYSARQHLRVDIDACDETIRRFIPGYELILSAAAAAVAAIGPTSRRESPRGSDSRFEILPKARSNT